MPQRLALSLLDGAGGCIKLEGHAVFKKSQRNFKEGSNKLLCVNYYF
jgi:hypothetical protein